MHPAQLVDSMDTFSSGSRTDYQTDMAWLGSLWTQDEDPDILTSQRKQPSDALLSRTVDTPFTSNWSGMSSTLEQLVDDPFSLEELDTIVQSEATTNKDASPYCTRKSRSPFNPSCRAANYSALAEHGQQNSTPEPISGPYPGAGLKWTKPLENGDSWETSHLWSGDAPHVHDLVGQAGQAVVESRDGSSFMVPVQTQDSLLKGGMHCPQTELPPDVGGTVGLSAHTSCHTDKENLLATGWWTESLGRPLLAMDACPARPEFAGNPFATERGLLSQTQSGGEEEVRLDQWQIPQAPSGGIRAAITAAKASAAAQAAAMDMPWMPNDGKLPNAGDAAVLSTGHSLDLLLNKRAKHPVVNHPCLPTDSEGFSQGSAAALPEIERPVKMVKQSMAEICSKACEHQATLMTEGGSMHCNPPSLAGLPTLRGTSQKAWRLDARPLHNRGGNSLRSAEGFNSLAELPLGGSPEAHKPLSLTGLRKCDQVAPQTPNLIGDYYGVVDHKSPWVLSDGLQQTYPLSKSNVRKRSYSSILQPAAIEVQPSLSPIELPHRGYQSSSSTVAALLMPPLLYQDPQQQQLLSQLSAQTPHNFPSQSISSLDMVQTPLLGRQLSLCQSLEVLGVVNSKVPQTGMSRSSAHSLDRQAGSRPAVSNGPDTVTEGGSVRMTHVLPHGAVYCPWV